MTKLGAKKLFTLVFVIHFSLLPINCTDSLHPVTAISRLFRTGPVKHPQAAIKKWRRYRRHRELQFRGRLVYLLCATIGPASIRTERERTELRCSSTQVLDCTFAAMASGSDLKVAMDIIAPSPRSVHKYSTNPGNPDMSGTKISCTFFVATSGCLTPS